MLLKLKALASAERLAICELLHTSGEYNVTDIADHIGLSQSATSQHLKRLRDAGLIDAHPNGNAVYYVINPTFDMPLLKAALS